MENHVEDRNLELESGSKNRYIVLLLVLTGVLMAVVDGSVVSIALPTITEYFNVSIAQSQMIMTSYLVTLTSLLMIFERSQNTSARPSSSFRNASQLAAGCPPPFDFRNDSQ
jgi:hypothetical protein